MEKLVNVTEQTNLSINAHNPLPSPYVTEFQQKQAEYIELLNKPNKTALDQFHIKRLGQRIQELTQRIQTEQAAPKQVQLQDTSGIREAIKDTVPKAIKQSKRPRMTDVYSQVETPPVRSVAIEMKNLNLNLKNKIVLNLNHSLIHRLPHHLTGHFQVAC